MEDAETMHPGLGPVSESELLYVQQLDIPARARSNSDRFVIWDVGLGAAANALAAINACRGIRCALHVISFDRTVEALQFGMRHLDQLPYLREYDAALGKLMREGRLHFEEGMAKVTWDLEIGDFPTLLCGPHDWPKPHAIFFDPFSPTKNPAMWTADLFAMLFRELSDTQDCALATYSRSTMVRVALLLAGFYVGRGHPAGRKEETTIAANRRELIGEMLDQHWLERARRSDSAEPLQDSYRQAPLSDPTYLRLTAHPQFSHA